MVSMSNVTKRKTTLDVDSDHKLLPETEADPVQRLFCQLNLAFDGLLVMFRL